LAPSRQLNVTEKQFEWNRREVEGDPLIYIVTMLVFFSAGIATLMIIYMKKVRSDRFLLLRLSLSPFPPTVNVGGSLPPKQFSLTFFYTIENTFIVSTIPCFTNTILLS
jgi:hypothetical protein